MPSIQDLNQKFAIVNPDGTPTDYFMRLLMDRGDTADETLDSVEKVAAELPNKADKTTNLIAGIGLDGGGDLSADRTFDLNASIDDLNDVDTATTPPTDGQALAWFAVDSLWKPKTISGGAGGSDLLGYASSHTLVLGVNTADEEDVPNMSVTFNMAAAGDVEVDFESVVGRASGTVRGFIFIDGVKAPVAVAGETTFNGIGMAEHANLSFRTRQIHSLTAGTHTIKIVASAVSTIAQANYKDRSLIIRRLS